MTIAEDSIAAPTLEEMLGPVLDAHTHICAYEHHEFSTAYRFLGSGDVMDIMARYNLRKIFAEAVTIHVREITSAFNQNRISRRAMASLIEHFDLDSIDEGLGHYPHIMKAMINIATQAKPRNISLNLVDWREGLMEAEMFKSFHDAEARLSRFVLKKAAATPGFENFPADQAILFVLAFRQLFLDQDKTSREALNTLPASLALKRKKTRDAIIADMEKEGKTNPSEFQDTLNNSRHKVEQGMKSSKEWHQIERELKAMEREGNLAGIEKFWKGATLYHFASDIMQRRHTDTRLALDGNVASRIKAQMKPGDKAWTVYGAAHFFKKETGLHAHLGSRDQTATILISSCPDEYNFLKDQFEIGACDDPPQYELDLWSGEWRTREGEKTVIALPESVIALGR